MFKNALIYNLKRLSGSEKHFGGNNYENVEDFVAEIKLYKAYNGITDALALDDFETVLYGSAKRWWKKAKKSIKSWNEAVSKLVETFKQNNKN